MQIVFQIALLEGFLVDSINTICRAERSIIEQYLNKKIGKININKILTKVQEKLGTSIVKRLRFLREQCGLTAILTDERLDFVKLCQQIRHIIVHNNAIINDNFIRKTKITTLKTGERFSLDHDISKKLIYISTMFSTELYTEIIDKFLRIIN